MGLCRDNGKENGNYYLGFRVSGLRVWGLGFTGLGFKGSISWEDYLEGQGGLARAIAMNMLLTKSLSPKP